MEAQIETTGDVAVVTLLSGQLDLSNCDDFRNEMVPVLENIHKLVLDLGRVEFVDSRGCGAIISCLKHLAADGGDLKLCRVSRTVRTVFELIRLHRICEIFATREEAVRAFQATPDIRE